MSVVTASSVYGTTSDVFIAALVEKITIWLDLCWDIFGDV